MQPNLKALASALSAARLAAVGADFVAPVEAVSAEARPDPLFIGNTVTMPI